MNNQENKYLRRGVSSSKSELHESISKIAANHKSKSAASSLFNIVSHGATKGAFATGMQLPQSLLKTLRSSQKSLDDELVFFLHADGAGSKPALAYLLWKETGNLTGFKAVAEDALVMNCDDLMASGVTNGFYFSSLISRNAKRIPGEVLHAIMEANAAYVEKLNEWNVEATMCGGETADVGDNVSTLLVDAVAAAFLEKTKVVNAANLRSDGVIVGLASYGKAAYETRFNSGISANGLTSARHDLLNSHYKNNFPETFNPLVNEGLNYCGKYRLLDDMPVNETYATPAKNTGLVWEALLSPTRTFLPIVKKLADEKISQQILAIFHNTGGGLTKCLRFGKGIHYKKNNLLPFPNIFLELSKYNSPRDLLQTFNCGTRLELLCSNEKTASEIISVAKSFAVDAAIIGDFSKGHERNELHISTSYASCKVEEKFTV